MAAPVMAEDQVMARVGDFLRRYPPGSTEDRVLREARFDEGLAFVHFDVGHGGSGKDPGLQDRVEERFLEAGCIDWRHRNVVGLGMAAPTLHAHGTDAQKALLRPLFTGEHVWCQLFSETGAGSDLASLATRAERDGDGWVINGQKVWTSLGHVAHYGILIARTDPHAPKHKGLTYFLLDMHLPGVEVRPLRQLTGEAEFNEVYLTDVRIPDSARIGAVGEGWKVAMTTLSNERASLGGAVGVRGSGPIGQAVDLFRKAAAHGAVEPELQDRLIRLWCRSETSRLMRLQAARTQNSTGPGAEGSLMKLQMAELNQAVYDLAIDLMGMEGVLYDSFAQTFPDSTSVHGGGDPRRAYLRTLANSIEGGTSEIQRNIIGERLLHLAAEPRIDKDRPWKEVPR